MSEVRISFLCGDVREVYGSIWEAQFWSSLSQEGFIEVFTVGYRREVLLHCLYMDHLLGLCLLYGLLNIVVCYM